MSFLFPLYLLGALAIAIPILLHLRKRPPKEHVEFSSLMFLEKSPERLTRRTKIERWLLLALRCLALILLALMFGRPFLRSAALQPEAGEGRRIFVLIDRSASMQREALWNSSVAKAEATLSATKATDEVAVAVFDESVRMIRDFGDLASLPGSARVGAFQSALSDAGVKGASWRSTRIGDALTEAAERLASASINQPPAEQEIVIISDFQEGADRDSLNRFAWPEDISVRPVAIAPDSDEGNLALHLVAAGLDEGDARADTEEAADRNRRRV
ncbi:MAG: BatA domain-containing protein, partial [Verrucomicrobiae bacterium]|nr:BatA domain-containing protein [Verrucomicrobiae bacterium]